MPMKCKFPGKKCPTMDTQDNTCLLRNVWDCPELKQDELLTPEEMDRISDLLFRRKYTELIVTEQLRLDQVVNFILAKSHKDRPDREKDIRSLYIYFKADMKVLEKDADISGDFKKLYEREGQFFDQILALIPDEEEIRKQRDIQWVKFLMKEKHYMSDIPPINYGKP